MINVFSTSKDNTGDIVIEYLNYFKSDAFLRIQSDNLYKNLDIVLNNDDCIVQLKDANNNAHTIDRSTGWMRRGVLSLSIPVDLSSQNKVVDKHITKEIQLLKDFIYSHSLSLGSYHKEIHNNRITNTLIAKECGLKIPETLITTSKQEVINFAQKHGSVITKPIHNGHLYFEEDDMGYGCMGTHILDPTFISNLKPRFCPSLFQAYVEKEVELRVFYLDGKLFPMAIFSQLDEQTKYDYRNYNETRPNRNVPFQFDKEMEGVIIKFMETVGLNTGSIDIILTPEGEYYFLEVNPTGQFGWVSVNCNYYLEREVALNLIENETR